MSEPNLTIPDEETSKTFQFGDTICDHCKKPVSKGWYSVHCHNSVITVYHEECSKKLLEKARRTST